MISSAFAQVPATPATPATPAGSTSSATAAMGQQLVMILLIFGIFYFLIIRPRVKEEKKRKAMLDQIKRGDDVITTSGIYGKVIEINNNIVMLQIAKDVIIKLDRQQIHSPEKIAEVTKDSAKK